ncbi:MAG: DegT/DnrJ/EryC1/StrS family aminotransferase [Clostridiaceae bacterium]
MEFRDLKAQYSKLKDDIDSRVLSVMSHGKYINGPEVKELEKQLAEYVGVKHCITCGNGTDALMLVLKAWGIGKGDCVFVPDFTFFASAEVISLVGATPIFVDVDPRTFNIDPEKLVEMISKVKAEGNYDLKAVIAVDLFGLPADYEKLEAICKLNNLKLLEDGAQGFSGRIGDRYNCSFGDAATTSFFPAKPLGCYGDGGAIFTNDVDLEKLIRSYAVHGKGEDKYDNVRIGVNSRLDTIQASILLSKFEALKTYEWVDTNNAANYYTELLKDYVEVPYIPENFYSGWAQYTIKLKDTETRDKVSSKLKEKGIPTMVYYKKPMHLQTAFNNLPYYEEELKVSTELCDQVLSLPLSPYISKEEIKKVADAIIEAINE